METTTTTSSWRSSLAHDSRQKIVKRIMDTLQRHMPAAGQDGVEELLKIAWRFEEKIFQAATDQQDYLRKISLKMLSLETKANGNALQARGAGGVPGQVAIKPDPAGQ
jgi:PAX-interacting protein 1